MRPAAALLLWALAAGCGRPTSEDQLPPAAPGEVWVLVVHGSGDTPQRWAVGLIDALRPRVTAPGVTFLAYDWSLAARDKLDAAGQGTREGEAIARVLLARPPAHLHVIAHSAGAFVAHGLEEALAGQAGRPPLHLTFLDPFLGLGLDFGWGQTRFGASADFADSYLDRGDGVPGTEISVRAAHTFDVTRMAARDGGYAGSEGHWWPTAAYALASPGFELSLEASGGFDGGALRARFPPGGIELLP